MAVQDARVPQHMTGLAKANRTRLARAELKGRVARGEVDAADVVLGCPWEAESMAIMDLLTAQNRWGTTRARRFLASVAIGEKKTIGAMTVRQRGALSDRLRGAADLY